MESPLSGQFTQDQGRPQDNQGRCSSGPLAGQLCVGIWQGGTNEITDPWVWDPRTDCSPEEGWCCVNEECADPENNGWCICDGASDPSPPVDDPIDPPDNPNPGNPPIDISEACPDLRPSSYYNERKSSPSQQFTSPLPPAYSAGVPSAMTPCDLAKLQDHCR